MLLDIVIKINVKQLKRNKAYNLPFHISHIYTLKNHCNRNAMFLSLPIVCNLGVFPDSFHSKLFTPLLTTAIYYPQSLFLDCLIPPARDFYAALPSVSLQQEDENGCGTTDWLQITWVSCLFRLLLSISHVI